MPGVFRRALLALGAGIALLAGAPAAFAGGAESFANVCAACHGAGGVGIDGLAPPLRNPAHWQALGERAPDYIANVLAAGLSGTIEVNGQVYRGLVMPAQTQLPAAEAAEIASWVLGTLNGLPQTVTAEAVEAARKSPLTHAKLRALRKGE